MKNILQEIKEKGILDYFKDYGTLKETIREKIGEEGVKEFVNNEDALNFNIIGFARSLKRNEEHLTKDYKSFNNHCLNDIIYPSYNSELKYNTDAKHIYLTFLSYLIYFLKQEGYRVYAVDDKSLFNGNADICNRNFIDKDIDKAIFVVDNSYDEEKMKEALDEYIDTMVRKYYVTISGTYKFEGKIVEL